MKTTRDNGLQMSTLRLYKLKGIFIIVICVREREREKDFLCKGVSFFTFENVGWKALTGFCWLSVVKKPGTEGKQQVVLNP